MISSDDKRKLIENLIASSCNPENALEMQKQLYEFLIQDTLSGKLYKYRSFDKDGFSLQNLNDNTLHCANPTAFNDPFDCKVGITFYSLYKAKCENEFDLMNVVLVKFMQVVSGELELSDCSDAEQRIILRFMGNERLLKFFSENQGKDITDEEKTQLICENIYIVTDMLQIFLSDESFASSLGVCASMLPKIIDSISPDEMLKISSDDATFEDFAHANGVCDDADEIGLTLRLSEKLQPELSSAIDDVKKVLDNTEQQMVLKMKEWFLIGCLCTDFKNRLMWSHYADSHKGFCVEYDYSSIEVDAKTILPLPVVYSDERPIVSWKAVFDNTPENLEDAVVQFTKGLLTKDSIWSYENEWRILVKATEFQNLPMPRISCVYLGASISDENRNAILKIAKKKNYIVKQMVVDRGAYALHAEDVEF